MSFTDYLAGIAGVCIIISGIVVITGFHLFWLSTALLALYPIVGIPAVIYLISKDKVNPILLFEFAVVFAVLNYILFVGLFGILTLLNADIPYSLGVFLTIVLTVAISSRIIQIGNDE